ncbi:MAG: diphthine synthase [Sulfolobales archaeon]
MLDKKGELYLVGMGLSYKYLTLEALEAIAKADRVFVDTYTGQVDLEGLEKVLAKSFVKVSRRELEEGSGRVILDLLEEGKRVVLLVPGDPLVATTHVTLLLEAHARGFRFHVIPGVSIVPTALSMSGLMVYKMGKIATVVYPKDGIVYEYAYDVIKANDSLNLHTLLLLEYDGEKGIAMRASEAIEILKSIEEIKREGVVRDDRLVSVVASLGYPDFIVCVGELKRILMLKVEVVPQTLVFASPRLHPIEVEMMKVVSSRWCRVE